ncbi:MAG: NUDIX hydrolase [Chthoniobacterales bacterium]
MTFAPLPHPVTNWEVVASQTRFENDYLVVTSEEVRTPSRPQARPWTVVHRKAAVVIAALTKDDKLLLIQQERIAIRAAIWEVPAGQIDQANADEAEIAAVARRELREETGYDLSANDRLIPLGHFFSSPGFTDEHGYFFLARGVEPIASGRTPDESEAILDCRAFSPAEVGWMIAKNEIRDANTLSLCARLLAAGLLHFTS